jgi:hypothetical protein
MEAEPELPYHIQAIYDLKANYSPEHFRYAIGICRNLIGKLTADVDSSDQQIARVRILRYLDLLLSRAVAWVEGEADLLAFVLRSEIELRGWAELVSESLERATKFLNDDVVVDAHELDEKMRKDFPGVPGPSIPSSAKRKDPPRIGGTVDYNFKLCSKLIHPSALLLNHPELTIKNEDNKAYLAVEVLLYAWMIVDRFHDVNWTE